MKRHILICLIFVGFTMTSCGGHKYIVQVKERTLHDTIFTSNKQYDSVYVNHDVMRGYLHDTLLIRERDVEFRYKLLRDTVFRGNEAVCRDSIPYEVVVKEVKEVPRKRNALDYLCYIFTIGALGYGIYRLIRKYYKQWKIFN